MMKKIIGLSTILLVSQGLSVSAAQTVANPAETAASIVDSFENIFGVTEGKRRNHTKGFCFKGVLIPNDKEITKYTNSPLFTGQSEVIGRFSHPGGNNLAPDDKPGEHGMGLSITTPQGQVHRMAMNTLDFFPVAKPEDLAALLLAKIEGAEAVKTFKSKTPAFQNFKKHMAQKEKMLTPYGANTFNSINSFYLVNDDNKKTAVRWSFIPSQSQALQIEPTADFLFENMQKNLQQNGLDWDMQVTIANDDDAIDNASIQWTGEHKQINAAKLKITSISTEQMGECDAINFDPLVLSPGFEPSDDPLLQVRRTSYAISFGKRIGEKQ